MTDKKVKPAGLIESLEAVTLTKRCLSADVTRRYHYQIGSERGTSVQVAPYYKEGKLVAQHIRFPDKSFVWKGKVGKLEMFGQHLFKGGGRRLIITEGEIDCMSIAQVFSMKTPVVSVPSGAQSAAKYIKQNLEWIEGYDEVVLAFDGDDPGFEAVEKVVPLITPSKIRVVSYPSGCKDANDMLVAGKVSELVSMVFNAKPYRPDGIIPGTDLLDIIEQPLEHGFEIPFPQLQKMLRGIQKERLYMVTAGSGIGKSTFVHEIGAHLMAEHRLNLGVIALEESLKETAERYLTIDLNVPMHLDRERTTAEEREESFRRTIGQPGRFFLYDHWGSLEASNLLNKMRFMAVGLGVDFIILDHISIAISGLGDQGSDERKTIDRLMTSLRSLVGATGVGVLAIVHLKRPQQGKSWNRGREVSLTDLRGSGSLEQLSDVVLGLERDQQGKDPNKGRIRVLKNRICGVTGLADGFDYTLETGRVTASEPPADWGKCSASGFDVDNDDF